MQVHRTEYSNSYTKPFVQKLSVEGYTEDALCQDGHGLAAGNIPLERQPRAVARAVGRLLDLLLRKNLLTGDEFFRVLGEEGYDRGDAKLVAEESA